MAVEALAIAGRARDDAREALGLAREANVNSHNALTRVGRVETKVDLLGAKLDTHKLLLDALRETQMEHGSTLREHGERLTGVEGRLDRLETKVDEGFSLMAVGLAQITALIKNAEREG